MACGVGACLGCVVRGKARTGAENPVAVPDAFTWVQTCTRGPVFWADEVEF